MHSSYERRPEYPEGQSIDDVGGETGCFVGNTVGSGELTGGDGGGNATGDCVGVVEQSSSDAEVSSFSEISELASTTVISAQFVHI